ncbi:hypothetical protein BDI4_290034 [Burkholderia diffusa]|nr:hypothetical protein BDI4_290034 [Burkholderia diffusa]
MVKIDVAIDHLSGSQILLESLACMFTKCCS